MNQDQPMAPVSPWKYKSTTGLHYDLGLLNQALSFTSDALSATVYVRPCGGKIQPTDSCPENSAVCTVDFSQASTSTSSAEKAISFGSSQNIQWSDGMEDSTVEAIYGSGEICNNGIARKSVVEYICNLWGAESHIVNVTMADDCSLQIKVESKYVCSIEQYCGSNYDSSDCKSAGVCQWDKNAYKCVMSDEKNHLRLHSDLLGLVLIACSAVLMVCTCGLCICACKRRRAARRSACKVPMRKVCRKSGKNVKKVSPVKEQEYAPFQVPFQLVPGGFAPNPYSEVQGYPMTTFVAPAGENQQV